LLTIYALFSRKFLLLIMSHCHNESELEKFIVDFVYDKVTARVRLHLSDVITVRAVKSVEKRLYFVVYLPPVASIV
jgi:hypothetical protein